MLAPVVVKPLAASKTASIYDGISPVSFIGTAPQRLKTTQESATVTKPSLA